MEKSRCFEDHTSTNATFVQRRLPKDFNLFMTMSVLSFASLKIFFAQRSEEEETCEHKMHLPSHTAGQGTQIPRGTDGKPSIHILVHNPYKGVAHTQKHKEEKKTLRAGRSPAGCCSPQISGRCPLHCGSQQGLQRGLAGCPIHEDQPHVLCLFEL